MSGSILYTYSTSRSSVFTTHRKCFLLIFSSKVLAYDITPSTKHRYIEGGSRNLFRSHPKVVRSLPTARQNPHIHATMRNSHLNRRMDDQIIAIIAIGLMDKKKQNNGRTNSLKPWQSGMHTRTMGRRTFVAATGDRKDAFMRPQDG